MHSIKDLLKKSDELNAKLKESVQSEQKGEGGSDDRFWYPSVDKTGSGYSIIRFLPAPPGEELAYVKVYSHEFKNQKTGMWYIENCLSTIGQEDPVNEYNKKLWATGIEANKNIAREQKRKTAYYVNIYIIEDRENPENNGKVKLMKCGPWAWNFINAKLFPEFQDETPVPVFDLMKGADFKIKIRMKDDRRNYDKCEWAEPSALLDGDLDKLEEIWNQCQPLKPFIAEDKFKDYETLKKRFNKVIGLTEDTPKLQEKEPEPVHKELKAPTADQDIPFLNDSEDDDEDYFAKLAISD